jgi:hypothetical protein
VMAGRMSQQQLNERREARANGALTGATLVEGVIAVRGIVALRAAGVTRADIIRVGRTVIPRGGGRVSIGWAIKGGGRNSRTGVELPYHFHITRYNWYNPWQWFTYTPIK